MKTIAIISVAAAVIILIILLIELIKPKESAHHVNNELPQLLETRDFSCSGVVGFTFQYPVFKGWEVKDIATAILLNSTRNECTITLNIPNIPKDIAATSVAEIIVTKSEYTKNDFEIPSAAVSNLNPAAVPTWYTEEDISSKDYAPSHYAYVVFYGKEFKYFVSLNGISSKMGFPVDQFFKTVINSFAISNK